jgi:sortase (surface protein transpeptidase)
LSAAVFLIASAIVTVASIPAAALADPMRMDYPVQRTGVTGHFYQIATADTDALASGFSVLDDAAAPLWTEYRRLGGLRVLGYPASDRYVCDGSICQAFQFGLVRWVSARQQAEVLRVFDWLHDLGKDEMLEAEWQVPALAPSTQGWSALAAEFPADQFAWLIRADGGSARDVYGQPRGVSRIDDMVIVRTQSGLLVQSGSDPAAPVDISAILAALDVIPATALEPMQPPPTVARAEPRRVAVPSLGIDAPIVSLQMDADGDLPTPSSARTVAWYDYSAGPSDMGNAVLAGHVDWNFEIGAFAPLIRATPGMTVTLSADGTAAVYRIESVSVVPDGDRDGLNALRTDGDNTSITLVTCGGEFDWATRSYQDRVIVRGVFTGSHPV